MFYLGSTTQEPGPTCRNTRNGGGVFALSFRAPRGAHLAATLAYTWLGARLGLTDNPLQRSQILYVAVIPLADPTTRPNSSAPVD